MEKLTATERASALLRSVRSHACAGGGVPAKLRPNVIARIRWLIEHHPGSQLIFVVGAFARPTDFAAYYELRTAWLSAIDAHGGEVVVLKNAANFFRERDQERAELLLRRVLEITPADSLSSMVLAGMIMQRAQAWPSMHPSSGQRGPLPQFDPTQAAEAIALLETAIASTPETQDSSALLMELTNAAAAANDWKKSGRAAQRFSIAFTFATWAGCTETQSTTVTRASVARHYVVEISQKPSGGCSRRSKCRARRSSARSAPT